jgi:hypothetical protein
VPHSLYLVATIAVKYPAMLTSRFRMFGLFAVLLALMAQLGAGATLPRVDPVAAASVLCHSDGNDSQVPTHGPNHPSDCPICPICASLHAQVIALTPGPPLLMGPAIQATLRLDQPPPSTAPPALRRIPSQPRAPPPIS